LACKILISTFFFFFFVVSFIAVTYISCLLILIIFGQSTVNIKQRKNVKKCVCVFDLNSGNIYFMVSRKIEIGNYLFVLYKGERM